VARCARFPVAVHTRRPAAVAAALATASAVVLLTACSGSGPDGAATPTGGAGNVAAFTADRDCLAENGVTLPSERPSGGPGGAGRRSGFPEGGRPSGMPSFPAGQRSSGFPGGGRGPGMQKPADVDDATWQRAQQACASVLPSFGAGRRGNGGNGSGSAYQNCLKDHGGAASTKAEQACVVLSPTPAPTS
jgi:hypothetical protein